MTRPELVLHLAPPHDAVEMLRTALRGLRSQLRQHGVAYVGADGDAADVDAADVDAADVDAADVDAADVDAVTVTLRSGVLPSEALLPAERPHDAGPCPDPPALVRRIIEASGAAVVRIVLHVQRQDQLIEQAYADAVLAGASHELADQFPRGHEPLLDFGVLARQLLALPQVSEIRVRPVELAEADTLAFVDDVLDAIGLRGQLDLSVVPPVIPASRRCTARGLRIAAAMNAHLDDDDERASVRQFLLEHFAAEDVVGSDRPGLLTDDDRRRILAAHAAANEALFATFMPDLPANSYCENGA